ncbi:DNL-type zinc finger protein-like [Galendromus occidentalis]|uniref:DNL-type zinc finger protein-like n=1 Tax=Galendromus occidentalis TaxID=34638 RepID=A0AAJ7L6I5_9ACAR|nr:DNL-type zinc finger protein-like [Galendromus occidentalis]
MQRSLISWSAKALRRFYCDRSFPEPRAVGGGVKSALGKIPDRRLYLSFKCGPCGEPVTKWLSKQAYDHGVVIVTCDHCRNRHLIADNLGWFPDVDRAKLPKLQEASAVPLDKVPAAGESS